MTTLSREKLLERAKLNTEKHRAATRKLRVSSDAQMDLRLAEIALATLESDPEYLKRQDLISAETSPLRNNHEVLTRIKKLMKK
ncbi:hypothetical protein N8J30_003479 [Salmonella enterica subsp. enterica serovar Newport]|nr:hypothetical protein [Salmonella enterica subsp. diarizonae]EJQ8147209.1 hypothetical protein [Salmonella enterica subsp. enterica serovar Newport]EJW0496381.1 hypothetical protein [Salmonella enterica subsp. enterica serovar Newport]ELA5318113.1 hypothetical protein [Salmonella enterica subsp. enterica serovar Newport]